MLKHITIVVLVFWSCLGLAQEEQELEIIPEAVQQKLDAQSYSFGVNLGTLSYIGDIYSGGGNVFGHGSWSIGMTAEKKLGTNYGVLINGFFGKVAKEETFDNTFYNFESNITHFDVNFMLDLDNGKPILSPFLSVGLGFLLFNPKGDLSADGIEYHLWKDGKYRDMAQGSSDEDLAVVVNRDYEYETELEGTDRSYSKFSLTFPIWAGFKFKLSRQMDVRVAAAYVMAFTDNIDHIATGGNDRLFYTSVGVNYNFVGKDRSDRYRTIDFGSFFNADSDNDGVKDKVDMCQETPEGVKVDEQGCAIDTDKDGVPDYKDKEPNTAVNAVVNKEGQAITPGQTEAPKQEEPTIIERKTFKSGDEKEDEKQKEEEKPQ